MGVLTRDDFLNFRPEGPSRELVSVPALGGDVYVRRITAGERDDFERSMRGSTRRVRAFITALVCVDADGKPLFTGKDIEWLAEKPAYALEPIIEAHGRLNSMTQDDIESLEKN